ncbi:MAG: hypothetical protein ACOC2F_08485 [Bacteroidota bacterium]
MKRACKLFYMNIAEQKASSPESIQGRPLKINFVRVKNIQTNTIIVRKMLLAARKQDKPGNKPGL